MTAPHPALRATLSPPSGARVNAAIAWLAVATHVVSTAAVLFLMRGGLPPFSDGERMAYIASHRVAWSAGWFTWTATVLSLIALYTVLAKRIGGALSWAALAISTSGAAIDISTHVRYIVTLPELQGQAWLLLDRELEAMTAYAANGMYTLSFVMFVIAGGRELPGRALVVPVAISGFALSIGALMHDWRVEMISTAILFPLFILWTIVIARWLRSELMPREREASSVAP